MHQTASCGSEGSVGDLARIARRLHELDFDVRAVGGGESFLREGSVGILSFLVEPDDPADLERLRQELVQMDLGGGRKPLQVEIYPGFDLEMSSGPGSLATAAETLSAANGPDDPPINIMSALLVDVHGDWAIVAFAFKDNDTRDRAARRFEGNDDFRVMPEHGGRRRRDKVSKAIKDKVKKGDDDDGGSEVDD